MKQNDNIKITTLLLLVAAVITLLPSKTSAEGKSKPKVVDSNSLSGLTRVTYRDDEDFSLYSLKELEQATGAKYVVISSRTKHPKTPLMVDGPVLHRFPGDKDREEDFVRSKTGNEPVIQWNEYNVKLKELLTKEWAFEDIEGKWDEFKFLNKVAAEVGAPETHRLIEYDPDSITTTRRDEITKQVKNVMRKYELKGEDIERRMIKLEAMRGLIEAKMGRAIVKACFSCHSEMNLPWSHEDWLDTYGEYLRAKEDKIDENQSYQGWVMNKLVDKPERGIVQAGIRIDHEVRIHILNGRIIKNATFLRYFSIDSRLTPDEIARIETEIESKFLNNLKTKLGPGFEKFCANADVAVTPEGKMYIIDLNAGIDSGYYHHSEDLLTANLLSRHLTGKQTPFLNMWDAMLALPVGPEKAAAIREITRKHKKFLTAEDDKDPGLMMWSRLSDHFYDLLKSDPTPENFDQVLRSFRAAGLKEILIWSKFLGDVQENLVNAKTGKGLTLDKDRRQLWVDYLNRLEPSTLTVLQGKRVQVTEEDQPDGLQRKLKMTPARSLCPLFKLAATNG